MEIEARTGLEKLVPKLKELVDRALEERQELDLAMPGDFRAYLGFSSRNGDLAIAKCTDSGSIMQVNTLPQALRFLKRKSASKAGRLMDYFAATGEFIPGCEEEVILDIIKDPKKTIAAYEQYLEERKERGEGPGLKELKRIFRDSGTPYKKYKKFIQGKAEPARKLMKDLIPEIESKFDKWTPHFASSIRHELDHIAFFQSPLWQEYQREDVERIRLSDEFDLTQNPDLSKKVAEAEMTMLERQSKVHPLVEARAIFFNFIGFEEWDRVDFESVKKQVIRLYHTGYVETSSSQAIMAAIVTSELAKGDMDPETSNYLLKIVNFRADIAVDNTYKPEKVDYGVVRRVLYEEFPRWQKRFTENAERAIEVIGNAYRDNPSRLRIANNARTFVEFLEMAAA